jgi:hypothetical protein
MRLGYEVVASEVPFPLRCVGLACRREEVLGLDLSLGGDWGPPRFAVYLVAQTMETGQDTNSS